MLDITKIYYEEAALSTAIGKSIINKNKKAELVKVKSHWQIPELNNNSESVEKWNKIKRHNLVLGIKKGMTIRSNGRSTDFIAPSHSNGCTMSCIYCYVARRKGYANPITIFCNIDDICRSIKSHSQHIGLKSTPNQCDSKYWTYDIGENSDVSVDALLSSNIKRIINLFTNLPNAKASFATKFVNKELLDYNPKRKTRIRFSLMPEKISKVVDIRTSTINDRISAINEFVSAGYEVHINFSPIIVYKGWTDDYQEFLKYVDSKLNSETKKQLQCEVIFLTHNEELHNINMQWYPKGESLIWTPQWQETKISCTGGTNLRYSYNIKKMLVDKAKNLILTHLPYCKIRYIF